MTGAGGRSLGVVRVRPQLALAAVAVGWGSIGVLVREIDLPAVVIVGFRVWIAALALGIWLAARSGSQTLVPTHRPWRVVAMGVGLAVHWIALFAALKRAPIGTVLLITYLAPVGIALLAPRTLGERLSPRTITALALGMGGMALVAAPALDASASGVVLSVIAAALYVGLVLVGKPLSVEYGGIRIAFLQLAVAGIVLVPVAAAASWHAPEASWAWLVVLGLGHTAIGLGIFYAALARMPASQVGILAYLEPASAVVFGWVFLSEAAELGTIAGGLLIVAAGSLVIRGAVTPEAPVTTAEVADVPG
jgi:drug/metabolite transporter (DMT)-like permease